MDFVIVRPLVTSSMVTRFAFTFFIITVRGSSSLFVCRRIYPLKFISSLVHCFFFYFFSFYHRQMHQFLVITQLQLCASFLPISFANKLSAIVVKLVVDVSFDVEGIVVIAPFVEVINFTVWPMAQWWPFFRFIRCQSTWPFFWHTKPHHAPGRFQLEWKP